MQRRLTRIAGAAAFVVLLVVLAIVERAPLLRAVVAAAIDLGSGYRVSFTGLDVGGERTVATGVRITRAGAELLVADAVTVRYRLRDLLPGGSHRYGLTGFDLVRPKLTIARREDGSFDVVPSPVGPVAASPVGTGVTASTPLRFAGTIREGTLLLLDPFRTLPESRRLSLESLDGSVAFDSTARSRYRLRGTLGGDRTQTLAFDGMIDAVRGYASHRLRARSLAIVPIVNYFINGTAARFESGVARTADLRIYGFAPAPDAPLVYHLAGSAELTGGAMRIPGIVPSAREMRGRVDFFDDGLAAPRLAARLGDLDVALAGGLYDWQAPTFRLGVRAAPGSLRDARALFAFSRDLPLEGEGRVATLLEGAVGTPLVATRVGAERLRYAGFPVSDVDARAIYYRGAVDVVGARGTYGGLAVAANGAVALGAAVHTQLVVDVRGPAANIPYLAEVAPGASVRVDGLLAGDGLRIDARGAATGGGNGTSLAGVFHIDPRGDGAFGPLALERAGGASALGAFYLNRSASESAFWLDARGLPYANLARSPMLPGLALRAPEFGGILDGSLAGDGPPSDFRIAGDLRGRDLRVGAIALASVGGNVSGHLGDLRLGRVAATGPWGSFRGTGAYVGPRLALEGAYAGTFERLATITGDLGAQGAVAGPVALLIDPRRTLVQARGDVTPGARVRGVPLDDLSGTLAAFGRHVRVYAARGSVASGTLVAAGTLDGPRSLGVSAAGIAAGRLHALLPLGGSGRLAAIGTYGLAGQASHFDGGIALGGGSTFERLPLDGSGDVSLAGSQLAFTATDAVLGPAFARLDGRLAGFGTAAAVTDARVRLVTARLGPFVRGSLPQQRYVDGTLTGDVRVRGTRAALAVDGTVGIPEGTVNGLAFRDASARVAVGPAGLSARDGRVTVGTTRTAFGASVHGRDAAVDLVSPQANLADFNDYFDAGDTLGGRGRIAGSFVQHGGAIATRADLAIAGLTYRRFDLGDASARWRSRGRNVTGEIAFGGTSGRLETAGTLRLPARAPLSAVLARSHFDGTALLQGLDLGVWLPALGYQLPVGGRVDAHATIAGLLSNPDVSTDATLAGGSIGKFPVDRLAVSARSTLSRTTITRGELELPSLSVRGTGSFGLDPHDRLNLALHATSSDLRALAIRALGADAGAAGSAEVDVKVGGSRVKPTVAGGFDVENAALRGVLVPRALGQFTLSGRDVVLQSVEVGFATGTLLLAGSVPIEVAPFALGPPTAPIALEVAAKGIDLADFAPLLPAGSKLAGALDGRVAIAGTAAAPRLNGALALARGSVVTPAETLPLTDLAATVAFAGHAATLQTLHAAAGGGTLDAGGRLTFADAAGGRPTYDLSAVAKRLRLVLPSYGSGQVDGVLDIARAAEGLPKLAGRLDFSDASIPFAALLVADPGGGAVFDTAAVTGPVVPPANDVAFDIAVGAERNVRVRSANVDIGARGDLHVGGTLGAPKLSGGFDSTGGTITYVNTVFRLVDGRVDFSPDLGLIPTLDVRAVTHVSNPDPNTVRNVAGTADVSLAVSGPVTNLNIALDSDPPYDRQQILGLLFSAPALGATNLFGETAGAPTPFGSTTLPGAPSGTTARSGNGQFSVAQEAFGIANAQFTRTLLAPFESSFAEAVGLSNFNVNVDYTGNVGLTARKILGKKVNAVYGTTFGYPYRQSFGFEIKPNDATAAQVTVFQTLGASGVTSLTPLTAPSNNFRVQAAQPSAGTVGFSLSLQRLFR